MLIVLFPNPMGPFDPKLKGFLITPSGFRVALPTTASDICDSFKDLSCNLRSERAPILESAPPPTKSNSRHLFVRYWIALKFYTVKVVRALGLSKKTKIIEICRLSSEIELSNVRDHWIVHDFP